MASLDSLHVAIGKHTDTGMVIQRDFYAYAVDSDGLQLKMTRVENYETFILN